MTTDKALQLGTAEHDALSLRLREELARRRMTRQGLADAAKISLSTLEKVLAGRRSFTLATIVRIEEGLGTRLLPSVSIRSQIGPVGSGTAPDEFGSYNRASVAWLEGAYLTIRPSFGEASAVYAYRTDIFWDETLPCLAFREAERVDSDYTQFGRVAVPHQSGHVYLVTNRHGQHRLVTLAKPAIGGEMHGLLMTLQSGKGSHLSPVAAPIVLKPLAKGGKERFGQIAAGTPGHQGYAELLGKTLKGGYGALLAPGFRS